MELLDLLLPSNCALCEVSGPAICSDCKAKFNARNFDIRRGQLSGFSATSYSEDAAKLIHEFKERGQTSLAAFFGDLISPRLLQFAESEAISEAILVPVPSSKSTTRIRGFQPAQVLAKQLGRLSRLPVFAALRAKKAIADQSALSREQRASNVNQSMVASSAIAGRAVILVDDIVTTGATISEAARAVSEAGGEPKFFLTFAETIRKIGNEFAI